MLNTISESQKRSKKEVYNFMEQGANMTDIRI